MSPEFAAHDTVSRPLILITQDQLPQWCADLDDMTARWIEQTAFTATLGEVRLIPGPDGTVMGAVAGLGPAQSRGRGRFIVARIMAGLPAERICYFHVAGHFVEAPDLRVDTHGDAVCDPVWALLRSAYTRFGATPTLLERDFNIPPLAELALETERIVALQRATA